MTPYERSRLRQLCDIAAAGGLPRENLFRECGEILERMILFQDRQCELLQEPASGKFRAAARTMGCCPMPGDTVEEVMVSMVEAESKRHRRKNRE